MRQEKNWNQWFPSLQRDHYNDEENLTYFSQWLGSSASARSFWDLGIRPSLYSRYQAVLDTHTGIWYLRVGQRWIGNEEYSPFGYDAFLAGGARKALRGVAPVSHGTNLGRKIPEFQVETQQDLSRVISYIRTVLPRRMRLLFRGQTREYVYPYPNLLSQELGYESNFQMPSLIPSIGRGDWDRVSLNREAELWKKPVLVWLLTQHPEWFGPIPDLYDRLRSALGSDDSPHLESVLTDLADCPIENISDFVATFLTSHVHTVFPLILQHYGFPTTYLDVTDDGTCLASYLYCSARWGWID